MTITKTINRLGTVFFLFAFNIGISISYSYNRNHDFLAGAFIIYVSAWELYFKYMIPSFDGMSNEPL